MAAQLAPPSLEYSHTPSVPGAAFPTTATPERLEAGSASVKSPAKSVVTVSPVGFVESSRTAASEALPRPGESLTEVETTVVPVSETGAAVPSSTVIVKVVVSVPPTATRFSAGSKVSPRIAVVAAAASPVKR